MTGPVGVCRVCDVLTTGTDCFETRWRCSAGVGGMSIAVCELEDSTTFDGLCGAWYAVAVFGGVAAETDLLLPPGPGVRVHVLAGVEEDTTACTVVPWGMSGVFVFGGVTVDTGLLLYSGIGARVHVFAGLGEDVTAGMVAPVGVCGVCAVHVGGATNGDLCPAGAGGVRLL